MISPLPVEQFLSWLADEGKTAGTIRTYSARLAHFERWLNSEGLEFTRPAFVLYLKREQERGVRPRTIRPGFAAIRSLADWMHNHELPAPILAGVKAPRLDPPRRYTPTDAEMQKLWKAALDLDDYPGHPRFWRAKALVILVILSCTAIRRCELLDLRLDDIHTEFTPWELWVRQGKGDQSRRIPINDEARQVLSQWFEVRAEWVKQNPRRAKNPALLPVSVSRAVGDNTINEVINRLNHRAGLERRITPHCIRHWAATRMASEAKKRNIGLKSISEILGHSSTHTTELYLHAVESEMQAAVAAISLTGMVSAPEPQRVPDSLPDSTQKRSRLRREVARRRETPGGAKRAEFRG